MWQELYMLVYRYLRNRGLAHADAEDLAQETLESAYRHMDGVEPGKLRAWVFAVARNRHIDWLRKTSRVQPIADVPETVDPADGPALAVLHAAGAEQAELLLLRLPVRDGEMLRLRYLGDLSVQEVAELLGLSVNTVKVGLYRARKRLRAAYEETRDFT